MSVRRIVVSLLFACACWPAPPADGTNAESSSTGASPTVCFDGVRNGDETDLDCGGSCTPCFGDAQCDDDRSCASGFCSAGRCAYLRSCRELQARVNGPDGLFWVDFDGTDPGAPAKVLCDQSTDGGGWMLGFKVHRAARDGVSERRETLRDGFNPNLLLDVSTDFDRGLASHGTVALSHAVDADSWARITLVAATDATQTATWFKRIASPGSLSRWFYDDDEMSDVCVMPDVDGPCVGGTIAVAGDATLLGGLDLRAHGYAAAGELHLRLSGTDVDPIDAYSDASGVCSGTGNAADNAWKDAIGSDGHWGNGLLIWIR